MRRLGGVLLGVLTIFVAIGVVYTLRHHDAVTDAAPPASSTPSTSRPRSPSATSVPASRPRVVAFVGDDWTVGAGASSPAKRATTLLSAALRVQERNVGVDRAGYVTGGGYAEQITTAVAAAPDVVVVMGGRNDVVVRASGTAAAARRFFATLHAKLPHTKIVAVAPMWGDSDAPPRLVALRAAVRTAVTAAGGTYLDVPDPIRGRPSLMANAGDPDDGGYRAIAAALEPRLAPLVG